MGSAGVRTLGRYELLQHFASGGMADVYLARTSGLEGFVRHVVVKCIRSRDAHDSQYVKMFLDEARLAASLHHQHVVQVHDVGHEDNEYYLAMEYVHGKDARALLVSATHRKEHTPLEHVIGIVSSAAAGLHYAHEQLGPDRKPLGIVHRDVSPSNILIGYDGSIKVADFGIAKAAHRSGHTTSGTFKGKIAYISPEQCRGKQADRRSDVFALGIVLYELITARRLFKAESDFLTMSAIVSGHVPPPAKFRPDVPPELHAIVTKALAVAPDERFQTADEMRRALEQFAAAAGLRSSTAALADFMRDVFGADHLEPWHAEGGIPARAPSLTDEDTSGSGLSLAPALDLDDDSDVSPDSPLARARRHPITSAPSVDDDVPPLRLSASMQIAVPLRSASLHEEPIPPPRPRRWVWGAAAAAVAVIAIVIVVVASSGGGGAAPAPPPAAIPMTATPPTPPPSPPPPTIVPADAPQATATVIEAPPSEAKPKPTGKPKPATKPKPKPAPTDPDWDRKSLFPK